MSDKKEKEYDITKCPFSWDKLDGLLAYKSSLVTCGRMLNVHENTVKNHIKARYGITFGEYSEKQLSPTKVKLVSKAIQMAISGNTTMMIFCLKNICGWKDKNEEEEKPQSIVINIDKQDQNL